MAGFAACSTKLQIAYERDRAVRFEDRVHPTRFDYDVDGRIVAVLDTDDDTTSCASSPTCMAGMRSAPTSC